MAQDMNKPGILDGGQALFGPRSPEQSADILKAKLKAEMAARLKQLDALIDDRLRSMTGITEGSK